MRKRVSGATSEQNEERRRFMEVVLTLILIALILGREHKHST